TAKVTNLPAGTGVTFTLDGQPLAANSGDKRSVDLDPAKLDPFRPHTLQARFDPLDPSKAIETTFNVATLAPKITDPAGVIALRPGDLVKVTVQSQPGVVPTVRFVVDGTEVEVDAAAPYQFTLAKDGLATGAHKLALVAEANGLRSEQLFDFAGPKAPAQDSNALKYAFLALLALALIGGAGYGGWTLLGSAKERRESLVVTDAPERLIKWADAHRVERPQAQPRPEPKRDAADAWGMLEITQGAGVGTKFLLCGSRVMVGRGKSCTVKLNDKNIQETHFLITSAGEIFASTPSCSLALNGEETRDGVLMDGALVGLGGTVLRFTTIASAERRQAS
ncbi:MAG: Ig-like domain-containing protein, partial [Anaerolineaceae bacterium]